MKKPATNLPASDANPNGARLTALIEQVRGLVQSARKTASAQINHLQVLTNFEIGRCIVEYEQQGAARAKYGKQVMEELSIRLTAEFGRGFAKSNLHNMRAFFLTYQERSSQILQKPSGESAAINSGTLQGRAISPSPFVLSWSHYVFLIQIREETERRFYEIEAAQGDWSLPELKRQFNSGLFERLDLSRDKEEVKRLAQEGQIVRKPADLIKDPYVLEFLGLEENPAYSETDLESAIMSKLQAFLLELGKGFLFEARQKRFTFAEDHFLVDLVFYNRLLRCYVLIDLKIGKLTHQDLGQMLMYVNYYDRFVKHDDETRRSALFFAHERMRQ